MTAPTPNAPTAAEAVKCPDCGTALRHVAGEDWACPRCKDPQTQSGQRYWRVVQPTAAEREGEPLTAEQIADRIIQSVCELDPTDYPEDDRDTLKTSDRDLRIIVERHVAAALLAARRENERMQFALRAIVDGTQYSLQPLEKKLCDLARAALAATPEGRSHA